MMTGTQRYPRHGGPAGAPPVDPAASVRDLQRDVYLRQRALQRLRYMNIQHAMHAWEFRYSDPLAPYGLAFLYAQPDVRRQGWLTLHAATKLWLAGPETTDLPRLLFNLNTEVAQGLDPRRDLANRLDEDMTEDAWYVGLGVSSLDTYSGTWVQACATVDGCEDVPGVFRIVMTDSTVIVCDRRGLSDFNAITVHATHALSLSPADAPYPWSVASGQDLHEDPAHGPVLRWMEELNLTLWRADNARLDALQQHAPEPRSRRRQP